MPRPFQLTAAAIVLLFGSDAALGAAPEAAAIPTTSCVSPPEGRVHCAGDTSAGVALVRSSGTGACLLGRSWGYDAKGVWVTEGCGGEFLFGQSLLAAADAPSDAAGAGEPDADTVAVTATVDGPTTAPVAEATVVEADVTEADVAEADVGEAYAGQVADPANETWGYLDPGKGFLLGKSDLGEASISAYALVRYLNQMDDDDAFTDHLGREQPVDGRNDIYAHRALVWLNGWVGDPKLRYTITWWTVTATDQDALFGNIGYQFNEHFNLYAGIFGNPGSRSMQGSHPYWLGHDRVMADEFFRPFFTQGMYANGMIVPGLYYSASIGNSSSTLGNTAAQLDRDFTYGGSLWWMPTTREFGPRGAYGDWEWHDELATRFGFSAVYSPEERYTSVDKDPGNTSLKLADSLNLFSTGALAEDVTVTDADYEILSVDAGMKYRGVFLQAEFYKRRLSNFKANGTLPVDQIDDWGFYVQSSFYPVPKKLEIYAATSQIFGDDDAGFSDSSEYLLGMNYYPYNTRNHRLNLQVMDVNRSPVGSSFGYYTSGQDGTTVSAAFSVFF